MLEKIGSLLSPLKDPLADLNFSQKQQIDSISEKLNNLIYLKDDQSKVEQFIQISSNFEKIFPQLNNQQIHCKKIQDIYSTYIKQCLSLNDIIFSNQKSVNSIFNSLAIIGEQQGNFANSKDFFPFFWNILVISKNDPEFILHSINFIKILLKDKLFFDEFLKNDGMTLIYTSFFVTNNIIVIKSVMPLLFDVIPPEFYSMVSNTTIEVCINSLMDGDEEVRNCPECACFLCKYVSIIFKIDESIFINFENNNWYQILNDFFINQQKCNTDEVFYCYDSMFHSISDQRSNNFAGFKENMRILLYALFDLYSKSEKYQVIALQILDNIDVNLLQSIHPIHLWVLEDDNMNRDAKICSIMYKTNIQEYLSELFNIIYNHQKYDHLFFKLVYDKLCSSKITINDIISNCFLDFFIARTDSNHFHHLINHCKYFCSLLIEVYSFNETPSFERDSIIFKIIETFNIKMKNCLITLLVTECSFDSFAKIISNIENNDIFQVFIDLFDSQKNTLFYDYFKSCNGLCYIEKLIQKNPKNIIKIISALTKNGNKKEIDEWIIGLDNDSPLFDEKMHPLLAEIAVNKNNLIFNVPSLLYFAKDFNTESLYNVYIAGKYGFKFLEKHKIEISKVKNFENIVSRFITPSIIQQIFNMHNYEIFPKFFDVNLPNRSVYECTPCSTLNSSFTIELEKTIQTIYFKFMLPKTHCNSNPISTNKILCIFQCNNFSIQYDFDQKQLIFKTCKNDSLSFNFEPNNSFNDILIGFSMNQINILSEDLHIDSSLNSERSLISSVIFGDGTYLLYIDSCILINNKEYRNVKLNGNTHFVPISGFAEYFLCDLTRFEFFFEVLNNVNSINDFTPIFSTILSFINWIYGLHDLLDDPCENGHIVKKLHINIELIFSKILRILKNQAKNLIEENLLVYYYQLPSVLLNKVPFLIFLKLTLTDYEFYDVFPDPYICSYLHLVKQSITSTFSNDMNFFIDNKIDRILMSIMSFKNDSEQILSSLLEIIQEILICSFEQNHDRQLIFDEFIVNTLSSSYWVLNLSENNFNVNNLFEYDQEQSKQQLLCLKTLQSILSKNSKEMLSLTSCLLYSLFSNHFSISVIFLEIIAYYSSNNANYIFDSDLLNYSFSRFCTKVKAWKIAFAILSGSNNTIKFVSKLRVNRPIFTRTVILMLCKLTSLQRPNSESTKISKLFIKVCFLLQTIPKTELFSFSKEIELLALLSNNGHFPLTIQGKFSDAERTPIEYQTSQRVYMSSVDLSSIKNFELYNNDDIQNAFIQRIHYDNFENTLSPDNEYINDFIFPELISFLATIIISNNLNNLFELSVGNALMLTSYQKNFSKELIINILVNFEATSLTIDYLQNLSFNLLGCIISAIKGSIFKNSDYLRLIYALVEFFKSYKNIIKYNLDDFKQIVILSFSFITDDKEKENLRNFIEDNPKVFFDPLLIDDYDYINILSIQINSNKYCPSVNIDEIRASQYISNIPISNNFDNNSRLVLANNLIEWRKDFEMNSTLWILKSRAEKISYLYHSTIKKFAYLNQFCRYNEQMLFELTKNKYRFYSNYSISSYDNSFPISELKNESYYLTPLTLPYNSPRVIAPSPFKMISLKFGQELKDNELSLTNLDQPSVQSKLAFINCFGTIIAPTNFCKDKQIFEYSYIFKENKASINILNDFKTIYGEYKDFLDIDFLYYSFEIPSILFLYDEKICLLIFANKIDKKICLNSKFQVDVQKITFLPFSEQILLSDFHNASLFCGHFVLTFEDLRFAKCDPHYYLNSKCSLSLFYIYDPNIILIFHSKPNYDSVFKRYDKLNQNTSNSLLFSAISFLASSKSVIPFNDTFPLQQPKGAETFLWNKTLEDIKTDWLQYEVSTFDYLVYLNFISLRSFMDTMQYPVFPWIYKNRNLELPIGQINPKKAKHSDEFFEAQQFFYPQHYSNPNNVFWFLIRLPPFPYFHWELNNGWDPRLFSSFDSAYEFALEQDLKELIPELFSIPEALINLSNLNIKPESVELPPSYKTSDACGEEENKENDINEAQHFVSMNRKQLEETESMQNWIDLIFGYKQTGEEALKAKNIFLPSSYKDYRKEMSEDDDPKAYKAAINNVGQCPYQIFKDKSHPQRCLYEFLNPIDCVQSFQISPVNENNLNSNQSISQSSNTIQESKIKSLTQKNSNFPIPSKLIQSLKTLSYNTVYKPQDEQFNVISYASIDNYENVFDKYEFFFEDFQEQKFLKIKSLETNETVLQYHDTFINNSSHMNISDNGSFVVISYDNGMVSVFHILYSNGIPQQLMHVSTFTQNDECLQSKILLRDFLVVSLFNNNRLIVWNFAKGFKHREFKIPVQCNEYLVSFLVDDFDGCISVLTTYRIIQYMINGFSQIREFSFNPESDNYCLSSFALFKFRPSFDNRILIVGDSNGDISFLAVDTHSNKLIKLSDAVNLFYSKIIRILNDKEKRNVIYAVNSNNEIVKIEFKMYNNINPSEYES